ncbi:hypothetical protein CLOM_g1464, partial [Closterium sp. NIES-68]
LCCLIYPSPRSSHAEDDSRVDSKITFVVLSHVSLSPQLACSSYPSPHINLSASRSVCPWLLLSVFLRHLLFPPSPVLLIPFGPLGSGQPSCGA